MLEWNESVDSFIDTMKASDTRRACFVTDPDSGEYRASHSAFDSLARSIAGDKRDYHAHEGSFFEIGEESGYLLSAHVHKTVRGQAAGGVRLWAYDTIEAFVRDGLRLSRGMGHKNALAGLWWGGGKGVIARQGDANDPAKRETVYTDYGRFMSGLCGCYITAEDAGTRPDDMANVYRTTRYTTCIPGEFGGSGNPSILTARGVVVAMEAALDSLGMGTLEGKTIAMQGLGNVSYYMVGYLKERGVRRIVGTDINADAVARVQADHSGADFEWRVVDAADTSIFDAECDVLAPNAIGATLNTESIPKINAAVVCGAANNQLEDAGRDAPAMKERGILYVPDFLANRMGIVNCANEQYGVFDGDDTIESHLDRENESGIWQRCIDVFSRAKTSRRTPADEAEALAEELSDQPHPIWGHRGRTIIDHLVASGWAKG